MKPPAFRQMEEIGLQDYEAFGHSFSGCVSKQPLVPEGGLRVRHPKKIRSSEFSDQQPRLPAFPLVSMSLKHATLRQVCGHTLSPPVARAYRALAQQKPGKTVHICGQLGGVWTPKFCRLVEKNLKEDLGLARYPQHPCTPSVSTNGGLTSRQTKHVRLAALPLP